MLGGGCIKMDIVITLYVYLGHRDFLKSFRPNHMALHLMSPDMQYANYSIFRAVYGLCARSVASINHTYASKIATRLLHHSKKDMYHIRLIHLLSKITDRPTNNNFNNKYK